MKISKIIILIGIMLASYGCYSLKGISIAPDIKTFYVDNFYLKTIDAPSDLDQIFSEKLRQKIRNESSLNYSDNDADISFSGYVANYRITGLAARDDASVELNQLTIDIQVDYENTKNEKDNFSKKFSFFTTFPSDSDLQSIQYQLIEDILNQITENIFNEAFTNW